MTWVKTLFDVLLAALILTSFEIIFFRYVISGTITSKIRLLVHKFAKHLGQSVQGIFKMPGNVLQAITDEEAILIKKYDESVIYDGVWIAGLLVIGLLITGSYLVNTGQLGLNRTGILNTLAFSIGTTALFIAFQIYFIFDISYKYHYPGQDETQYIATNAMIKALHKDLGH